MPKGIIFKDTLSKPKELISIHNWLDQNTFQNVNL